MIRRASLIDFAVDVSRLEGGIPWKPYPYLRYIESRILAALRNPRGGRLIINIPPRLGKSFLVSKYLPLWYLECAPERSVMVTSYGDTLAQEWGRKVRDLLALPQLDTTVRRDVSATTRWETDLGGGMVTSGVGGPILGKGFHLGVVDDPLKSWDEAQSPVYRRKVNDWFDGTFMSRAEPGATVVIIQQRLHERDLAGHLLAEYPEEWDLVALPGLAEKNDPMGRQEGEPLCPDRFDLEAMERIRDNKSPALWDAMYQQHPRPPGGTIIHEEWLKYYEQTPAKFDRVILSWDMTFKKTTAGSFVVGQAWGKLGADCYLLGQTRRRMDFDQSREAFVLQCEAYPEAAAKIIEDKANGPAIVSSLEGKVPGLIEWPVRGSKESRAHAVAPFFRAGNVLLPKGAKWMREYVAELTAFPGSENDDQVDATTQALDYLMLGDAPATITGYKPAQQSPMRSARRHM